MSVKCEYYDIIYKQSETILVFYAKEVCLMNKEIEQTVRRIERIMAYGKGFSSCANDYTNGGCYVYAKIMAIIIKGVHLYISNEECHVICEYKGFFWDSEVKDGSIKNLSSFVPFKGRETNVYCLDNYGLGENNTINSIDEIIRTVKRYIKKYGDDGSIKRRLNRFENLLDKEGYERKNKDLCERLQSLDIPERFKENILDVEKCFASFDCMNNFHPYSYTHGGCYQYARVLSFVLGVPTLYLSMNVGHCAMKIGKEFLDSEGICKDEISEFSEFSKDGTEDEYCIEEFGIDEPLENIEKILTVAQMYLERFCPDYTKKNVKKRIDDYICLLKGIGYCDFVEKFNIKI